MNKKIIFGSIISTIVISLAGFTAAVGVEADSSLKKSLTPLYNVRVGKTLYSENDLVETADYVGQENSNLIKDLVKYLEEINKNLPKTMQRQYNPSTERTICYGLTCIPTCILEIIIDIIFIITVIFDCMPDLSTELDYNALNQKIRSNFYFKDLIYNNPELASDIINLNN